MHTLRNIGWMSVVLLLFIVAVWAGWELGDGPSLIPYPTFASDDGCIAGNIPEPPVIPSFDDPRIPPRENFNCERYAVMQPPVRLLHQPFVVRADNGVFAVPVFTAIPRFVAVEPFSAIAVNSSPQRVIVRRNLRR